MLRHERPSFYRQEVDKNIKKYIKKVFRNLPTRPDSAFPDIHETERIPLVRHKDIEFVQFHKIFITEKRGYWGMEMRHYIQDPSEGVKITTIQFAFPQTFAIPSYFETSEYDFQDRFLREIEAKGAGYELLASVFEVLHSQDPKHFSSPHAIFMPFPLE